MRVIGMMCIKNEARRYLREVLEWNAPLLDVLYVFDDNSHDESLELANQVPNVFAQRFPGSPSFDENEGRMRNAAWMSMELATEPEEGDLIVALDADELLMIDKSWDEWLEGKPADSFRVKIDECFGSVEGVPQTRIDGYWDYIANVRIAKYVRNASFEEEVLGGGSLPKGMMENPLDVTDVSILHLGYASYADRLLKYRRYSQRAGRHNHRHIESILLKPKFRPWGGAELPIEVESWRAHSDG